MESVKYVSIAIYLSLPQRRKDKMNDCIAESIKKFKEKFGEYFKDNSPIESFLKQELQAITEKTREDTVRGVLKMIFVQPLFKDERTDSEVENTTKRLNKTKRLIVREFLSDKDKK